MFVKVGVDGRHQDPSNPYLFRCLQLFLYKGPANFQSLNKPWAPVKSTASWNRVVCMLAVRETRFPGLIL